jgi:hypothetical protein
MVNKRGKKVTENIPSFSDAIFIKKRAAETQLIFLLLMFTKLNGLIIN